MAPTLTSKACHCPICNALLNPFLQAMATSVLAWCGLARHIHQELALCLGAGSRHICTERQQLDLGSGMANSDSG